MAGNRIGSLRGHAARLGMSFREYSAQLAAGLHWCTRCKKWQPRIAFGADASRSDGIAKTCLESRKPAQPSLPLHFRRALGWDAPTRDGDKLQARARVNYLVQAGRLANPNTIACTDCGHLGSDRRHEYDHYLGYSAAHHFDVQAVCSKCHHDRERKKAA